MLYESVIIVPRDEVVRLQAILDRASGSYMMDDEVVETFTAKFPNSPCEVDIKVVDADPPYVDPVLFNRVGVQVGCLDVADTLCGKYVFTVGEDTFSVVVRELDPRESPLLEVSFGGGDLLFRGERGGGFCMVSQFDRATCPSCGVADCVNDCDGSQGADEADFREEFDAVNRQRYNAGLSTVESLVLSLVCSGVLTESESPQVNEAIQSCLDAIGHQFLG